MGTAYMLAVVHNLIAWYGYDIGLHADTSISFAGFTGCGRDGGLRRSHGSDRSHGP